MTRHDAPHRAPKQLQLPFFMGTTSREGDMPVGEPDELECLSPAQGVEDGGVPDPEEISSEWLEVMPDAWRRRLLARAELTGAMNLWTLSAVTGVPTWQLR